MSQTKGEKHNSYQEAPPYHVIHKLPPGDSPYVRAKHVQACNLCFCLMKQKGYVEAQSVLDDVLQGKLSGSDDPKSRNRAEELLRELEAFRSASLSSTPSGLSLEDAFVEGLDQLMSQWTPYRSRRLPIFEKISPYRDQLAC